MLTETQMRLRSRGLHASELAAIAGLSRYRTALDVWATKRRGAELELDPLVPWAPEPDEPDALLPASSVGHLAEDLLVQAWEHKVPGMGVPGVVPTLHHPDTPWQRATPDRLVYPTVSPVSGDPDQIHRADVLTAGATMGLECKMVGAWMVNHWDDGCPDYVTCQVQWNMHVTGLPLWHVVAWLAGSSIAVLSVERDEGLIQDLVELARWFWSDHVLANVPPEPVGADDMMRLLGRRWAQDDGQKVDAPADAAPVAHRLHLVQSARKALKDEEDNLKAVLASMVGPHKAIADKAWGSFHFGARRGRVAWKALAEDINGGPVPEDIQDRHRGDATRTPVLYPSRALKALTAGDNHHPLLTKEAIHDDEEN